MKDNVYLRLALYIIIACTTSFIGEFSTLTIEEVRTFDPLQWGTKIISILLPGLITWRAYIDQTISRILPVEYQDNI